MNEETKQKLNEIHSRLDAIRSEIDSLQSEEEDYMWNIPENLQESDRYYAAEEAVDNLESASSSVDDAIGTLDELLEEEKHE